MKKIECEKKQKVPELVKNWEVMNGYRVNVKRNNKLY